MALVTAIGLILSIVIPVALISINSNQYSPTWGPLNNIVNFVQDLASVFTVVLAMKLFGADEKPVFRVMSMVMIAVGTMWAIRDLAPTANAQSVFNQTLTATEVAHIMGSFGFGSFVLLTIWFWTLLNADGGELIPRYAFMSGRAATILFVVLQVVGFFAKSLGLSQNLIAPLWLVGGLILWPIAIYGVSRAFAKKL